MNPPRPDPPSDPRKTDRPLREQIAILRREIADLRSTLSPFGATAAAREPVYGGREPLVRVAGMATWAWEPGSDAFVCSADFCQLHGLDPDVPATFETWLETIHADHRAMVREAMAAAVRGERAYDIRFRVTRDGSLCWIAARGTVFFDNNNPLLVLGIEVDATERYRAEDDRMALASIVESSEDAVIGKTLDGVITTWNRGAERIFGYSAAEAIGQPVSLLACAGHEDEGPAILEAIRRGERVEHFETVLRSKSGETVPVSLTVSPVRDSTGNIVGASRIARNISRQKQAEARLREAEGRYRDLFENSPLSVAVIDPEVSRFVESNRMFTELLGYTSEEVMKLRVADIAPDFSSALFRALAEKEVGEQQVQFVTPYLTKSGERIEILITARPMRREDRILIHSIGFDISAQRRADETGRQLREKEALLKEIHHRVKNNLQVVSSLLGLHSRSLADEQLRRVFQESQNRIHSMALLHESLYQSESLSRVDFPSYVRQLASYLFHSYGVKPDHVRLRTELESLSLAMDTAMPCGLIINELLSNSLKYAFPEGRNGEVWIALYRKPNGKAHLVVADNGVGMGSDVDWTRAKSLGLRLVRSLAQQLDAELEIETHAGTEVRLTFAAAA